MKALHVDVFLTTSIRYSRAVLCPWVEADSHPLKGYGGTSPMVTAHLSSIRQMLRVPPKPSYAGDGILGRL